MALNSFGEDSIMAIDNIKVSRTAFPDSEVSTLYKPKMDYGKFIHS